MRVHHYCFILLLTSIGVQTYQWNWFFLCFKRLSRENHMDVYKKSCRVIATRGMIWVTTLEIVCTSHVMMYVYLKSKANGVYYNIFLRYSVDVRVLRDRIYFNQFCDVQSIRLYRFKLKSTPLQATGEHNII